MELKEGMTLREFKLQKKPRGKGKNNADYSTSDYFEHYRHSVWRYQGGRTKRGTLRKRMYKNGKWTISKTLYRKILCSINSLLLEAIFNGEDIELPIEFGTLYARVKPTYIHLQEDGSIKTNRAVNWNETLNLWYEDKEARDNKQIVYQENCNKKAYMRIQFGDFTNKRFLSFTPAHNIMRTVSQKIGEGVLTLPPQGARIKAIKDIK